MAGFNLDNYETVKSRKKRFFTDYPDGRIIDELLKYDENSCTVRAAIYKNVEEQEKRLPLSIGHAQEFKGQGGMANKFSWLENCCESAVGRALDNAGYATDLKCSREEMVKVKRMERDLKDIKDQIVAVCTMISELKPSSGWFEKATGLTSKQMLLCDDIEQLDGVLKSVVKFYEGLKSDSVS